MKKQRIETANPWEKRFGYARAVRAGSFVAVSGTVAADDLGRPLASDPYGQTVAILERIQSALAKAGGSLADVVRLRVLFVDSAIAPGFLEALKAAFPNGAPALTAIRVAALVTPDFLLEIEAEAILGERHGKETLAASGWAEEAD